MKYRLTTRIYDGETACGPCKFESTMESLVSALCAFDGTDSIMMKMMMSIERTNDRDRMEEIKIVTEMVDDYGDWAEDAKPGNEVLASKVLTYKEYRLRMGEE